MFGPTARAGRGPAFAGDRRIDSQAPPRLSPEAMIGRRPHPPRGVASGAALSALLGMMVLPSTAFAYVDPSSGSILLQLLLGGVAGILVAVKLWWKRLTGWRSGRPAETPPPNRPQ